MCNNLKNGSRIYKIPEHGFGYKVMTKNYDGKLISHILSASMPKGEWIVWEENFHDDGFCFLGNRTAVKDYLRYFFTDGDDVIYRIRYRKGLGKRKHGKRFMSSLCKEFKILQEVAIKELK